MNKKSRKMSPNLMQLTSRSREEVEEAAVWPRPIDDVTLANTPTSGPPLRDAIPYLETDELPT
jgi:hypothetical protein